MFFGMRDIVAAWRKSTFNMCSQTSTLSKLSDMYHFHHRISRDYPRLVSRSDVLAGDSRLLRMAFQRLGARTLSTVTGWTERRGSANRPACGYG